MLKIVHDQDEILTVIEKQRKAELLVPVKPIDYVLNPELDMGVKDMQAGLTLTHQQVHNRKEEAARVAAANQENSNNLAGPSDTGAAIRENAAQPVPKGVHSHNSHLFVFPPLHT